MANKEPLTKAGLVEVMANGGDPAAVRPALEAALAKLGWQAKDSFDGPDALKVADAVGQVVRDELRASSDPATRQIGEHLEQIAEIARGATAAR